MIGKENKSVPLNMVDRVDSETRYRIMRANRGKDTGPELEVRRALFARGFRYRLHDRTLPGKPDMVLARYNTLVFVHGCFWHGHSCQRRPRAKSNTQFWKDKIEANKRRDLENRNRLLESGWRVLAIWECAVRRHIPPFAESTDLDRVASWLRGNGKSAVVSEDGFKEYL